MSNETVNALLIEDESEHVELLQRLLAQSEGAYFSLKSAGSLKDGLGLLADGGFHLVILDLSLPDSDGIETFSRVLDAAPDLPIVILSGAKAVALAVEAVQMGAQDYLVKGQFDRHLLARALQYAIERKRIEIELRRANDELEQRVVERTGALLEVNAVLQQEVSVRKKAEQSVLAANQQLAAAIERLEATQEQVIRRERMHALGRMAQGMAHDFNNALAPILGFSELLLMKPELMADEAKLRNYLEIIHTAAKDSERVTSRLREFYRYREPNEMLTSVGINDLVLQAISITQPRWKGEALAAGVTVDIRTEMGNVPSLRGNERDLREMLVDLIFNAVDAIEKRGTVTIRTQVQGRWLVLSVSDDGAGMTEEVRAQCIEPFFSTKGGDAGGLGLGTVYGIVRRHDGEIDIQSEPGRGTTVTISMPLDRGTGAVVNDEDKAGNGALNILVVEDEPLVREVITVYLQEDNHRITQAVNGREGIGKFRAGHFDLVLTDRAMPEMNGDELALEIRKINSTVPIVLLTGFGDLMAVAGEKPEGVDMVVSKPFTLATLRTALATALTK